MNASGKQVGHVDHDLLADLLIHADATLHAEGRVKVGIDVVERWNGRSGIGEGAG